MASPNFGGNLDVRQKGSTLGWNYLTTKVLEKESMIRVNRMRSISEEVMICLKDVVGKNRFWVIYIDGQEKEISTGKLMIVSTTEE